MEEKFNIVKKGYDPEEVNKYVDTLETVLNSYKEKDTAIKNALISAQVAADNIVKNAEIEADKIKGKAIHMLNEMNRSLEEQRQFIQSFQMDYNSMIQKYLHQFNDSEILKLTSKVCEMEDYITKLKSASPENEE